MMSRHAIPAVADRRLEAFPRIAFGMLGFPVAARLVFHLLVPRAAAETVVVAERRTVAIRTLIVLIRLARRRILRFVVGPEVLFVLHILVGHGRRARGGSRADRSRRLRPRGS